MKHPLAVASCVLLLSACSIGNGGAGTLTIKGSDTEVQLVSALAEAFSKQSTDTKIAVAGGGSATGIAALLNGDIDIANSSRQMSESERKQAEEKGMTIGEFILARDGLSLIVHPDNPVRSLTIEQAGKLFSGEVKNWKEVGGPDAPVSLYGRQSTSGTFTFFRSTVVNGEYALTMRNMESTQAIVDAIKTDVNGIGYAGVGYVKNEDGTPRSGIHIVPVRTEKGDISPLDAAAVEAGTYPITRVIYQYVAEVPDADSPMAEFLRFEGSKEGQVIVEKTGFYRASPADRSLNDAFFSMFR